LLVTVNSSGVAAVAGTEVGFSQITASEPGFNGDIISNASTFTVNLPTTITTTDVTSLSVVPASPVVAAPGLAVGFSAIGTTGTGTQVNLTSATWTSSNLGVATINATTGAGTTNGAGTSAIVATYTNPDGVKVTGYTILTVE